MHRADRFFSRLGLCLSVCVLAGCVATQPAPVSDRRPPPARGDPRPDGYTVKRGDTLYSIALEHGMDWRELAALNGISDPTRLAIGQSLRVKPQAAPVYTSEDGRVQVAPVAIGPSLETRPLGNEPPRPAGAGPGNGKVKTEPKAIKLPYSEQNLASLQAANSATSTAPPKIEPPPAKSEPPVVATAKPDSAVRVEGDEDVEAPGSVDWAWPAAGRIVSRFADNGSKGVQITGRGGDPVLASAAGKVTYAGDGIRGYGNLVIVKHNEKYLSVYAHNKRVLVQGEQTVSKGQKIAEMGHLEQGKPVLHFEIRRFGKPVDPLQFLPERSE